MTTLFQGNFSLRHCVIILIFSEVMYKNQVKHIEISLENAGTHAHTPAGTHTHTHTCSAHCSYLSHKTI